MSCIYWSMYADYREVESYCRRFSCRVIGKSYLGRNIYSFSKGTGGIFLQAGIHAREHITTRVLLKCLEFLEEQDLPYTAIPLANPDGVELSLKGLSSVPMELRGRLREINGGENFTLWKSNARGIDLNVNFPAKWGFGANNIFYPSSANYVGTNPFSESETRALALAVTDGDYRLTLSLHAKGEEIYYGFMGELPPVRISNLISSAFGYPIKQTLSSCGGFKDWVTLYLKIPSYTVELGEDSLSYLDLYRNEAELVEKLKKAIKAYGEYRRDKD